MPVTNLLHVTTIPPSCIVDDAAMLMIYKHPSAGNAHAQSTFTERAKARERQDPSIEIDMLVLFHIHCRRVIIISKAIYRNKVGHNVVCVMRRQSWFMWSCIGTFSCP